MTRPIPAFTLPALAVCAVLSGCAGTPGPDATPVRTASARINATTVAQPDPSAPVAGWTRFAEMKDGSVRVTAEIRHLKPGGAFHGVPEQKRAAAQMPFHGWIFSGNGKNDPPFFVECDFPGGQHGEKKHQKC